MVAWADSPAAKSVQMPRPIEIIAASSGPAGTAFRAPARNALSNVAGSIEPFPSGVAELDGVGADVAPADAAAVVEASDEAAGAAEGCAEHPVRSRTDR